MTCSKDACSNKVFSGNICLRHYRFANYGTCKLDGCRSPASGKTGICDNCARFGPAKRRHLGKTMNTGTHKYCEMCKSFKSRDDFYIDRGNTAYLCKECHSKRRPRARRRREAWKWGQENVLQTSAYLCVKCWFPLDKWEADHIIPFSLGGSHSVEDNIQIMCVECNRSKSNRESIDYRILIKEDEGLIP